MSDFMMVISVEPECNGFFFARHMDFCFPSKIVTAERHDLNLVFERKALLS